MWFPPIPQVRGKDGAPVSVVDWRGTADSPEGNDRKKGKSKGKGKSKSKNRKQIPLKGMTERKARQQL